MRRIFLAAFLLVLVSSPVWAQTGQINGVVTDNTNAVVPGATVKAIEVGTGFARETVSGSDGRYSFTSLRPSTYNITAELTGFRTFQHNGVVLQANQAMTVNMTLQLGELSETVTVAGETASVDITTATISEVVDSKRIVELPLNGRDAARLSTLVSGMVLTRIDTESAKTIPGALRLSTNGTEDRQVSFRLDGTSHTDTYFQQNQPFPFPDALQEFSIQTSNYSAGQGNSAGAVVNAVTRSGTNNLNGGVFTYIRDGGLNSANYFSGNDFLKRKQFGGYAGGPIQRNKIFFFAGWQGTTIENVGGTLNQRAPTIDMRNGNFATCGSLCNTPLRDPNGGFFPNNQIPVSRFDPAAVNVLKYIPLVGGDGNVQVARRIGQNDNQVVTKVDYQMTQNNQLSVRYFIDHFTNDPTFNEDNLLSYRNPTLGSRVRMQNVVGSWQRTLSPTLLNEFRLGYNKTASRRYPPDSVVSMQELGVRLPIYPTLPSISQIEAQGFFNIGDNLEASFPRHGYEINDRITWATGRHNLQFGGEAQLYTVDIINEFRRAGHFLFTGGATGHPIADFLLGRIQTFDQGTGEYKDYSVHYGSAFLQDDFKVSSRLTLNLGLRYEYSPPWHEEVGRIGVFRIADYNANVRSQQFPQAARGETFRGDPGVPEDGTNPEPNNIGFRGGFAWDISGDGRTSLRGGGGMFYDQHRDGESGNGAVNTPPWSLRLSVTQPTGPFSDPYLGRSDFNLIKDEVIGTPAAPFPVPIRIETLAETYKTPVTYNYNITFEREVMRGIVARAAYVGSQSKNGRFTSFLNPAVYTPGDTRGTDARRIYAADSIGHVLEQQQNRESIYNSMQLTLSKRYSHGFQISSNYTLSKVEGDFGDQIIPYNETQLDQKNPLLWGPLNYDHRHRFTTSWVMDLPGGDMQGPMRWVLAGWQWTGVMQFQTGQPFNIVSGRDNSQRGLEGTTRDRAKLTGVSVEVPAGSPETIWFNPAAFTFNDVGTFGDVPRGYLYGPNLHSWDMGLFKNFRMGGNNLQFRAEFFNIFNQVNFDIPGTSQNDSRTAVSGGANNFEKVQRTVPGTGDPRIIQFGLKFAF